MSQPSIVSAIFACLCLAGLGAATLFDMADGPGTQRQERIAPTPKHPTSAEEVVRLLSDVRFYVANRYALKDLFVELNGQAKIGLFAHSPAHNVAFGGEGFLFLLTEDTVAMAQGQDRLDETTQLAWRDHFTVTQEAFAQLGMGYAFVMGPNKHSIYPDLLPDWIMSPPQGQTLTSDISHAVDDLLSAPFDSREVLLQARTDNPGRLLYHPTDTHWTEWGAALVLDRTLEALGIPSAEIAIKEVDQPRSGDLARMIGQQKSLRARAPVLTADYTCTAANGANIEITTIDPLIPRRLTCGSAAGRPERLVVFHDSFGLPAIPYLAARFASVEFIASDSVDPERAAELHADIVLQIIVERKLRTDQPSNFLAEREIVE